MLRLLTFGGLGIESDDGSAAPRLKPPRLAVLAVLAGAGDRGVSRDRLAAFFWPDADDEHARHSLRQILYALRRDFGHDVVRSTGPSLSLDETAITADVVDFHAALAAGDRARAVALARGPFLDGFYLTGTPAFERWVEEERSRLTATTTSAIFSLAADATRAGQHDQAVEWWRQLTTRDPVSGRFAVGYLRALAARGDRAEALAFARRHETIMRRELEADPDPDVRRLEAELRAMPSPEAWQPPSDTPSHSRARSPAEPPISAAPTSIKREPGRLRQHSLWPVVVVTALMLVMTAAFGRQRSWRERADPAGVFAVGLIREDGVADSLRIGRVLTDMLATNLARMDGLAVLANSRVLELMRPDLDSAASYADAARRAGASELLEGRLFATPRAGLALEMRRVDLHSGIVTHVFGVSAADRYALVDSLTRSVARQFGLTSPRSSVAQAMTPSATAYRLYEEGLRAYFQSDAKAAQRLMRAALDEDSTFAMAAYYEATLAANDGTDLLHDGRRVSDVLRNTLRLARRAPERERLTITANMLAELNEPAAVAVAESLTTRYPDDPRALMTLGKARLWSGAWSGAVAATEHAIRLDSIGESNGQTNCQVCQDFSQLSDIYLWADSLSAAARTARRFLRAKPTAWQPWYQLSLVAARLGDSASADAAFRRLSSTGGDDRHLALRLGVTLEQYDRVERDVRPLLASSSQALWGTGAWMYLIALRNQGRLREATQFHRTGALPGIAAPTFARNPDVFNEGILALERGDPRTTATVFAKQTAIDMSRWVPGVRARYVAWNNTLRGMGLAAAGDTVAVRALADSVERWGSGSGYGRDRKAHHYLRGLVLASAGRHEDAARAFRAAMHSPTLGFTRVNFELGKCLLALGRARDAVAAVEPALRGEVDASNLYVTRTELHELLAEAFDRAGERDSAAVHYQAVVNAWRRADPEFRARRERASAWLQARGHSVGR